jgi:superfamily I DNA/RNA helicase
VLVLFPHKKFSIAIAKELRSNRIPFAATLSVPGRGLPLVSAVASWLANQSNSVWFRQCLEAFLDSPASGIPSSRARKRDKKADREAAFRQIALLWNQVLSGTAASLWESLAATKEEHAILSAAWAAFTRLAELHDNGTDIEAFSAHLANYFSPWRRVRDLMDEASSWVELASQWDTYGHNSGVRLMTLQGAKGLEAKVVCVVGLQEGVIPKESDDDLAEQSRLLFVSMTRAINELHLFYARKRSSKVMLRTVYKKGTQPDLQPSRFLNAIPQGHCRTVFHRAQPNPKPRVVGSSGLPKD